MSTGSAMAGGLSNTASKTSSVGTIANIAVPLLLSLFAKKATPDPAKQTANQNATTLANMPPEIQRMLTLQADNAAVAAPVYRNAMAATNRLLPAWARGEGVTPSTGGVGMGPTSSVPASFPAPSTAINFGSGEDITKSPEGGGGGAFYGMTTPGSTGNSIDPQIILGLLSLLGLGPVGAGLSHLVKKPGAPPETNFTLT